VEPAKVFLSLKKIKGLTSQMDEAICLLS